MSYSKGVSWVADCRIPFVGSFDDSAKQGRFTPNLLVCDDMLNDGSITETNTSIVNNKQVNNIGLGLKPIICKKQGDKGTNSRYYSLDLWFDKMLEKL